MENVKTIVALRGKTSTGKTTTIKILHNLLMQNNYVQISTTYNQDGGDFAAIFSKHGRLIGVSSSGDSYDALQDSLNGLAKANCSICICACRTSDMSPRYVNKAIKEFGDYHHLYIDKKAYNDSYKQIESNFNQANNILGIIDDLL